MFRERVEKHKEEIAELEEREKLVEKDKPVSVDVLPKIGHKLTNFFALLLKMCYSFTFIGIFNFEANCGPNKLKKASLQYKNSVSS